MIDLQTLHGIGPKRAERIIKYREEVSSILNIHDLATAAGMSLKQADSLSHFLEWEKPKARFSDLVLPILTFSGSFLLIVYGFSEIQLERTSATRLTYNISLLLIMVGCISLISEQLIFYVSGQRFVFRPLAIMSITTFVLGIISLLSLIALTLLLGQSPDLTNQMTATANFLIFIFLIIYLINAPSIHLKRSNLYSGVSSKHISSAVTLFDYGLLLLAPLVFIMLTQFNSGSGIEEIFAIWASVLLASSGMEMARGHSAYVSLLSLHEKETLDFIRGVEDSTEHLVESNVIENNVSKNYVIKNYVIKNNAAQTSVIEGLNRGKLTGAVLVGMSVVLAGLAMYQLV